MLAKIQSLRAQFVAKMLGKETQYATGGSIELYSPEEGEFGTI